MTFFKKIKSKKVKARSINQKTINSSYEVLIPTPTSKIKI